MLLTVVIPYFRAPALLGTTLDAVLQALRSASEVVGPENVGVLIVDDSADASSAADLDLLVARAAGDIRLAVMRNERNLGIAPSRNRAAAQAEGRYLHFLDQDDLVDVGFYREMLASFGGGVDVVVANCAVMIPEGASQPYLRSSGISRLCRLGRFSQLAPLLLGLSFNPFPSPGQLVVRRERFLAVGGFPELRSQGADDYGLWLRLCGTDATMKMVPSSTFTYRLHGGSSRHRLKMLQSAAEARRAFLVGRFSWPTPSIFPSLALSLLLPAAVKRACARLIVRTHYSPPSKRSRS